VAEEPFALENWPAASTRQVNENLGRGISEIMRTYQRSGPSEVPQTIKFPAEYHEVVAEGVVATCARDDAITQRTQRSEGPTC
jgi:hypothetical protein